MSHLSRDEAEQSIAILGGELTMPALQSRTEYFRYQDWIVPGGHLHTFPVGKLFTALVESIKNPRLMEIFQSEGGEWRDSELLYFGRALGMPDFGSYRRLDRPDRAWTLQTAHRFVKLIRDEREDLLDLLGISNAPLELIEEPTTPPVVLNSEPETLPEPPVPSRPASDDRPDAGSGGGAVTEDMPPPRRPKKRR